MPVIKNFDKAGFHKASGRRYSMQCNARRGLLTNEILSTGVDFHEIKTMIYIFYFKAICRLACSDFK
jgi:hypothetical protein